MLALAGFPVILRAGVCRTIAVLLAGGRKVRALQGRVPDNVWAA